MSRNLLSPAEPFTVAMKSNQRISVMNKIAVGLSNLMNDLEGKFYSIKDMPEEIKI